MNSISDKYQLIVNELNSRSSPGGVRPKPVEVIAVSKKHPIEAIQEAMKSGIRNFGENRARELRDKAIVIPGESAGGHIRWHMIGHLQTNKVKEIINHVDVIHSLDRISLARELQKQAERADRSIDCLIQINISGEIQKYGLEPAKLSGFLTDVRELDRVNVIGLMGMASFSDDEDLIRQQFSILRTMRDETAPDLPHLSMGMSNDYLIAVDEGATMLRIGTLIFGPRPDYH